IAGMRHDFDCAVPVVNGRLQTTLALYGKKFLATLKENLKDNNSVSLTELLKNDRSISLREITEDELKEFDRNLSSFTDIDTPEELEDFKKRL
ncbi:MAG: hypothetical protein KAR06_12650, partial [Deltaproteobacteria bacterium]|nr:hypothetical protein [Deltaproteobacteria bacterium]